MSEELLNYLRVVYPKQENKKQISIRINDLYISELTRSFSETGYATIVMDIIEHKDSLDYVVLSYAASTESNSADVTSKHDDRLKSILKGCLSNYSKKNEEEKKSFVFDKNPTIENKKVNGVPPKGLYLAFSDVLNNKPADLSNFEITNKDKMYYLVNKGNNSKELNYYGFSDGENFYINVSKYASTKYYAKTDIIANKYYIEDVVYNADGAAAYGAMFGLIGSVIASTASESNIPMLIDCYSGQPTFLSKSELKTMLQPYPLLVKEYKDSNKTSKDKKEIIKKYYGVTN